MTPSFIAPNFKTLTKQEQIRVLQAQDRLLALEMEIKQREQENSRPPESFINSRHVAYANAYPLKDYIREAFPIIEQGRNFKDNWHLDIIAELLQAATLGEVRNFIINIPRRTSKSTLTCVLWPTWVWTFLPQARFLFTSYQKEFAKRDNEKCKNLINSTWYQQNFPGVKLAIERREKIENTSGGFRVVFRIGKGVGEGGDFVIADDPNDIEETETEKALEDTARNWSEISYHNVTDKNTAVRGIIQQRTNTDDLTGSILDNDKLKHLYIHLCLPMTYESDHETKNDLSHPLYLGKVSIFDKNIDQSLTIGDDKWWIDPRDKAAPIFDNRWYRSWYHRVFRHEFRQESEGDGQLLWPQYMTKAETETDIAHLGVYGESAQYQQRPVMRGGNFFLIDSFLDHKKKPIDATKLDLNGFAFCRFWDKAGSKGKGDYTTGMLVGKSPDKPFNLYILDIIREQVEYKERMELMIRTAKSDREVYINSLNDTTYSIGIEKELASSGKDLATIEKDALIGYEVFTELPRGTKAWRALVPKGVSERGRLKVVQAQWTSGFLKRLAKFKPDRVNQKDDEVDTLSGACRKLIFGITDEEESESGTQ
jgi:phage terminase large subunit-like protein